MTIIPNQPFGLGDIIFCQTLVRRIADGRPIVWPVLPQFVEGLTRAYPDITFVDWTQIKGVNFDSKEQYETQAIMVVNVIHATVLPIRFASEILGGSYPTWMSDKYKLYGMDYNDWREAAMWEPNFIACDSLLHSMQLFGKNYRLKNTMFGSDSKLHSTVTTNNSINEVSMSVVTGYSLFDWQSVIINASEIHTVNTSIIYLLEMLDLKAKEVHLYQRSIPGQTFAGIDYLLKRHKYVYHG